MEGLSISDQKSSHFYALIEYEDPYVQPLILEALRSRLSPNSYTLISSLSELPTPSTPFLQISAYESLLFEHIMEHPTTSLTNAYIIRKALIRKHYLSTTAYNWITKNPSSILATNTKPSCDFELDYAEFLDDALVEAWELQASFQKNEGKEAEEREWWILKPGMSDRGQGIRLFSSEEELQAIFEEWEEASPDSDEEDDDNNEEESDKIATSEEESGIREDKGDDYIVTSHLRHFIAQPYIHPPLLLSSNPRKFHIRTYVLASGSLKVHVYRPMLALFAPSPYTPPYSSSSTDLSAHLTNTCLQTSSSSSTTPDPSNVQLFWDLDLPTSLKDKIFSQICEVTGEIFEAAAKGMMVHFQTLPNAFEIFGVDFLVGDNGTAWLLEVNAFPDFRQTGDELKGLVGGLWGDVVEEVVGGFFGVDRKIKDKSTGELVLVKELDLGRK